jgi:ureidoglycolate hydrolase
MRQLLGGNQMEALVMPDTAMSITPQQFDPADWKPYGWVPVLDTDPRDGSSRLEFQWNDVHLNVIGHDADEVPHTKRGLVCQMLFRHQTHTQALQVLNCPAVVVVAAAGMEFGSSADAARLQAFLLRPLDAFVLHRGTWHWGPFPINEPRVNMLNVQGLRYAEDNDCCKLSDVGASVEVITRH